MAISNEGCKFLCLDPSIEMAITPTFFDQFENFHSSTPQGLPRDIFNTHVARIHVPKTCLEVCEL